MNLTSFALSVAFILTILPYPCTRFLCLITTFTHTYEVNVPNKHNVVNIYNFLCF
jgi:hypothetical protein